MSRAEARDGGSEGPGVPDVLARIVAQRRRRVPTVNERPDHGAGSRGSFAHALRDCDGTTVIAEVKMGSPKLGRLEQRVDPLRQASIYRQNGAAALSVVVEPDFFFGSYELLARCVEESGLPAIAKDFLVDERQLDWAHAAGASAILLIAVLYDRNELRRWAQAARDRGLEPLVETHDLADLAKLRRHPAGEPADSWELVGINNRDLRTFEVDLEHSIDLHRQLPPEAVSVAESGIHDRSDVERLETAGFDAFLIGESLLLATDPARKLTELRGLP